MTTNFNLESLIVPLQDDAVSTVSSSFIKMVKEKEDFVIYSLSEEPLYFSIVLKSSCNGQDESLYNGNLTNNTTYRFKPIKDGEYIINYTTSDNIERNHIFTHYPMLTKSFVKSLEKLLCDCGCDDKDSDDCQSKEAKRCLAYQELYGEMLLLFGLSRNLSSCDNNYNVLYNSFYNSLTFYKCDLFTLFCNKEVDIKIKGNNEYNEKLLKKIVSIMYLLLYFYEKEISNQTKEFLNYVNTKYNYKVIKEYILKTGIEVLEIEHLFMSSYYAGCGEEGTCTFGCIIYEGKYFEKQFDFELNEVVNGIYDNLLLKNNCSSEELYVNNLLYRDNEVRVIIKSITGTNPTSILPGESLSVNIIITGSKAVYTVINVPFIIDGITIGKYKLVFSKQVGEINNPPIINDIIKNLSNGEIYNFTVADFENNFIDQDGDILGKIVLVGDTSNFTLNTAPYMSGTIITRDNINKLTFTAPDSDQEQQLIVQWKAYDSRGLESN